MANFEAGSINFGAIGGKVDQLLFKPVFFDADYKQYFDIMRAVTKRKKIGYVGTMEDIIQKNSTCGFNPKGSFSIFERCIEADLVKVETEQCYDEFLDTVYEELLNSGNRISDLTGTVFLNILETRISQGIRKDIQKIAFFGDESAATLNQADGMWSVYIPNLVTNNLVPYINSGSGVPLVAGDALDLLEAVYRNATKVLKSVPNNQKVMLVSSNVYEQYMYDLQNGGQASGLHFMSVQDGFTRLFYQGIEIVPMYDWQDYADSYLGLADANLVLYTERKNMVLATDVVSPETSIDVWFDKEEEKIKTRTRFRMGFNYKHNELFTVAY